MPQEYQPSGALAQLVKSHWAAAISLPMRSMAGSMGYLAWHRSRFPLALLAVLVSGAAAGFLARWSHCRSPAFREGGLVVVTLGYGVNWAVFLSSQPELGDHRVLTFLLNPMNAYTGLAHMLTTESYAWFGWTPPATAGHRVAAGISRMVVRRALGEMS